VEAEPELRRADLADDPLEQFRVWFAGAANVLEVPDAVALARTPLHAAALRLPHPSKRGFLQVEAPLPEDLAMCLDLLRAARREAAISSARAPASSRPP